MLDGEVRCPKRLWAGMARDACCREPGVLEMGCPPRCEEGARARDEREAYREWWRGRLERRRRLGKGEEGVDKVRTPRFRGSFPSSMIGLREA